MRDINTVEFVKHVLIINSERYALPGTKWFIPGDTSKGLMKK